MVDEHGVGHGLAERSNHVERRLRVDDRHVAAEEHRLDTVGRHREIERSASIRRRIEPDMREHRASLVDAACGHALELDRRAAGEDREDDVEVGPARGAGREPGDVRGLHLRGVVDDRRPPRRRAGRSDGGARMDEQKAAALRRARRAGARARRGRAARRRRRRGRRIRRRLAGGERDDAAAGRVGQLQDPGLPRLDQLERFVRRQPVDPECRLQRDDRAVELEPVHAARGACRARATRRRAATRALRRARARDRAGAGAAIAPRARRRTTAARGAGGCRSTSRLDAIVLRPSRRGPDPRPGRERAQQHRAARRVARPAQCRVPARVRLAAAQPLPCSQRADCCSRCGGR